MYRECDKIRTDNISECAIAHPHESVPLLKIAPQTVTIDLPPPSPLTLNYKLPQPSN